MNPEDARSLLHSRLETIVRASNSILHGHAVKRNVRDQCVLEYACVFPKSNKEFRAFTRVAKSLGKVVCKIESGDIIKLDKPLIIQFVPLYFLKIRLHDPSKRKLGECDFKVSYWKVLKRVLTGRPGVVVDQRPKFTTLRVSSDIAQANACFSSPSLLDEHGPIA